jgi:hypothetical protein
MFLWLRNNYAVHGLIMDVYRLVDGLDPPLDDPSRLGPNGEFYVVTHAEAHVRGAILMQGGRGGWAPARTGGERDLIRILKKAKAAKR